MGKRRIGQFSLDYSFIENEPEKVRELMGQCIIVRAEYMLNSDRIEYTALCDKFEEVEKGHGAPNYYLTIETGKLILNKG